MQTHHFSNVDVCLEVSCVTGTGTFVKDTPHSFLLRQQPIVESGHLFKVCTGANKQQAKHQDAIKRIHCGGKIDQLTFTIFNTYTIEENNQVNKVRQKSKQSIL